MKLVEEIFRNGIESLQEIPQLEPILLHRLFRNKSKKNIKAPNIPHEKPKPPANERGQTRTLIDENIWLWRAFEELIQNMERAIGPLEEYVQTFSNFAEENALSVDDYLEKIDKLEDNEKWNAAKYAKDI